MEYFKNKKNQIDTILELEGYKTTKILNVIKEELEELNKYLSVKAIKTIIEKEIGIDINYRSLTNWFRKNIKKGGKNEKVENTEVKDISKDDILGKVLNIK